LKPKIDFLDMESLILSDDSEELYWKFGIVQYGIDELLGIVDIYRLARAGRREDILESIRNGEDINLVLAGACYGGS
jgi:hypothetical protein